MPPPRDIAFNQRNAPQALCVRHTTSVFRAKPANKSTAMGSFMCSIAATGYIITLGVLPSLVITPLLPKNKSYRGSYGCC